MKKLPVASLACAIAAGFVTVGSLSATAQTLALQLQAGNYNPITGVWTDTSGNGDNAAWTGLSGTAPALATGVTPNGSSAVNFTGSSSWFSLVSAITASGSTGYTIFAVFQPSSTFSSARGALTGGSSGSLEYNIYQSQQDALVEYTSDPGHGTAVIPTSSFSIMDVAINNSGGAYRLNGVADGTAAGTTYSPGISIIGNNHGAGDQLKGYLSEIDIYTGVLSAGQISTVEANLTAAYITPVPEPSTLAMTTAGGFGLLLAMRNFRRVKV